VKGDISGHEYQFTTNSHAKIAQVKEIMSRDLQILEYDIITSAARVPMCHKYPTTMQKWHRIKKPPWNLVPSLILSSEQFAINNNQTFSGFTS
jgi:hypothetical protein